MGPKPRRFRPARRPDRAGFRLECAPHSAASLVLTVSLSNTARPRSLRSGRRPRPKRVEGAEPSTRAFDVRRARIASGATRLAHEWAGLGRGGEEREPPVVGAAREDERPLRVPAEAEAAPPGLRGIGHAARADRQGADAPLVER